MRKIGVNQQRPWSLPAYRTHVRCRVAGVVIELPEQTFIRPDGHPVSFALMTMHWLRPNTAGRGSNADGRCAWAAPQSKSPPTTTTVVSFCLDFISAPRRLHINALGFARRFRQAHGITSVRKRLPRRRLSHRCASAPFERDNLLIRDRLDDRLGLGLRANQVRAFPLPLVL